MAGLGVYVCCEQIYSTRLVRQGCVPRRETVRAEFHLARDHQGSKANQTVIRWAAAPLHLHMRRLLPIVCLLAAGCASTRGRNDPEAVGAAICRGHEDVLAQAGCDR